MWQPDWSDRLKIVASYVSPDSVVMDFGCGMRYLKNYLPDGCLYAGIDKEDVDFDSDDFPPLPYYDVACCVGVLEWLEFPTKLVNWFESEAVIVTYDCFTGHNLDSRIANGWKSHLRESELVDMFFDAGYLLEPVDTWMGQTIFVGRRILESREETERV